AGTEGQVFALTIVLELVQRDFKSVKARIGGRKADGEARDLASNRHVALEGSGGGGEDVAEGGETAVRRFVAGQEGCDVEVQGEEITDGVLVFGAIQTVNGADLAGVRRGAPGTIDLAFERDSYGAIGCSVGPGEAGRWHGSGAELSDDAFESRGV